MSIDTLAGRSNRSGQKVYCARAVPARYRAPVAERDEQSSMEAKVASAHLKRERKARFGGELRDVFDALDKPHLEQPVGDGTVEHHVRMKGANYVVITGAPNESQKAWAENLGIRLDEDDEVIITVKLSNEGRARGAPNRPWADSR